MNRKLHHLASHFEVKSTEASGIFTGYASVFGVKDHYGDIVVKGAFEKSLAARQQRGLMPALLWQHDSREPIGFWKKMVEDEHGLFAEGQLLIDDDPLARRAFAHLKAKSVNGLSIGFITKEERWNKDAKANELVEIDLWETSIVTFPANEEARVETVKARDFCHSIRDFETMLRDAGFSRSEAKALASNGWPAINRRDVEERSAEEAMAASHQLLNILKGGINA